jgi:hypothetical protein
MTRRNPPPPCSPPFRPAFAAAAVPSRVRCRRPVSRVRRRRLVSRVRRFDPPPAHPARAIAPVTRHTPHQPTIRVEMCML